MDTGNPLRALQAEVNRLRDENQDLKDEIAILRASMDSLISLDVLIQSMKPDTDVLAMLDDVLASALNAVGASAGSLLLVDPEKDELAFAVVHGQARIASPDSACRFPRALLDGWPPTRRAPSCATFRQTPASRPGWM